LAKKELGFIAKQKLQDEIINLLKSLWGIISLVVMLLVIIVFYFLVWYQLLFQVFFFIYWIIRNWV
jgi:hypothetical protein